MRGRGRVPDDLHPPGSQIATVRASASELDLASRLTAPSGIPATQGRLTRGGVSGHDLCKLFDTIGRLRNHVGRHTNRRECQAGATFYFRGDMAQTVLTVLSVANDPNPNQGTANPMPGDLVTFAGPNPQTLPAAVLVNYVRLS